MKQFKKDLPIYINGFVVTSMFLRTQVTLYDALMFGLAFISFMWYGHNQKNH